MTPLSAPTLEVTFLKFLVRGPSRKGFPIDTCKVRETYCSLFNCFDIVDLSFKINQTRSSKSNISVVSILSREAWLRQFGKSFININ